MERNWQKWMDRLISEDLSAEELREFEAALKEDPDQMQAYMDALLTETSLESESLTPPSFHSLSARVLVSESEAPVSHFRLRPVLAWIASTAACVALTYFLVQRTDRGGNPVATVTESPEGHIATITDADMAAEGVGIRIGAPLKRESIEVPENSKIGIAMRDGARLEVNGPAKMTIESADKIRLSKGRLKTYAPSYAQGFSVDTDDGEIVDLGTEFVTVAGTDAGTEVHVLTGLVKARPNQKVDRFQTLTTKNAAVLKDGKMEPIEYLERRLDVPLDPVLPDQDGDGVPDIVENYYGTDPLSAASKPVLQRFEESFSGYAPGSIHDTKWQGDGKFITQGLDYQNHGKKLLTSGGALQTTGKWNVGAYLGDLANEFPPQGVTYLSFLGQYPSFNGMTKAFGGLLLYSGDREELYVGQLNPTPSYGSIFRTAAKRDAFRVSLDKDVHLFVIRIDRTRLLTDVFIDPPLGQPESSVSQNMRYYDVPDFDRLSFRSGATGNFPVVFDEVRGGLTWESVLPLAP